MTKDEELKQLIEDLISAMEYHVEQTRPIHSTKIALQAAREALKAMPTPLVCDCNQGQVCHVCDPITPPAQPAPVQGPSIRFNTAEAMDKAKADRDKPVTPVEYIPVISEVGSDSNMVFPDTMYGLLPKGTGKITLHESKPAQQEPVALVIDGVLVKSSLPEKYTGPLYTAPTAAQRQWVGLTPEKIDELMYRFAGYELLYAIQAELKENNT